MRILKWVGFLLAGFLALCALGIALVSLFFDPNKYKNDIERLVQERLQRQLTLQGDLKLSFFPWLAVELGAAKLGDRSGFGDQPFVSVEQVRLRLRLLPLFQGAVEIGDVRLDHPSIRLLTDERGRHNWADLAGQDRQDETARRGERASRSGPIRASVASIQIRNAMLVIDNRQEKSRTAIRDFSLSTGTISATKPFDLKIDFVLEQDKRPAVPVQLAALVTADFEQQRYRLQELSFATRWFKADQGEGVPVTARMQSMSLDVLHETLAMEGVELGAGRAKLAGGVSGKDLFANAQFTGQLQLAAMSPREVMRDLGMTAPVTRDGAVLKKLQLQAQLQATKSSLSLQDVQLTLDDTTAKGQLSIADFDSTALRFDLKLDQIDLDRYLPPPATQSTQSPAQESARTPLPTDLLRALNVRGDLRIDSAKFSGMRLSKLHVAVNAREGNLQLSPTEATLYGGQYRGAMNLDASTKLPRLTLESHVNDVDFAPLFKDLFATERASGHGNANVKVTATGSDTLALQKSLAGTLDFNVTNGAFEGTDLWFEIRRARALLHREALPVQTGAARTPFTSCKGTGVIRDGVVTNNDLDVAMQMLKVAGQGSVDIVKSAMDYKLNVQVLRAASDTGAGDLVDAQIPVKISGPLAAPSVRPDIEGLVKARVRQELDKQKDKLRERLEDKLKDFLGGK